MTLSSMKILLEICDTNRKFANLYMGGASPMGSDCMFMIFDKITNVITEGVGNKYSNIENEDDRERAILDVIYDYDKTVEERAKELLSPMEIEV